MEKFKVLTICFLAATSLSTEMFSQAHAATPNEDVAQTLYKANKALLLQQRLVDKAYKSILEAHDNYVDKPDSSTYQKLKDAVTADLTTIQNYRNLVDQAKKVQAQIEQAQSTFYGETPATHEEIEKGPEGKGTPPGGESLASEIPIPPPVLVTKLKQEIQDNGGPNSPFAAQLRTQADKLKSVQDRITKEAQSPAVQSNPAAQKEDTNLVTSLQKAIEARRKALGFNR
ncbi:MAG: hypothetical protein BGO67_07220 [Alphaproteobacteria bacterium 41-28]|nr:MAG: hypothetical protein BGO67_07220 [Alphaproteobacteria bacterium 41-28]